jgi:F-type H+-transporting ATPase subunit delta
MLGVSRESQAALEAELDVRLSQDSVTQTTADDLLAAAGLIGRERGLRTTLTDAGQPVEARLALVDSLFGARIDAAALEVLKTAVALRWTSPRDLVGAVQHCGLVATLALAEKAGQLDRVEEELFRFGRLLSANGELGLVLDSTAVPADDKQRLVAELLDGRVASQTQTLLQQAVLAPLGRSVEEFVLELTQLAAARRGRLLADVTVAIPLTGDQERRLAAVLERIYGRGIDLQVAIDPSVRGGVRVRVGEEIIDGTVDTRLEQAARRVAG